MNKIRFLVFPVLLVSLLLSGCYFNDGVDANQMGLKLKGGKILQCVGPGIYTDLSFFSDLQEISSSTVTFGVDDPEVATKDNQLVGISITIQARRDSKCDALKNLMSNWPALLEDENLISTVSATAREGIKVGTRSFTLQELLDDRNGLSSAITTQIEGDSAKYSVSIINVTIENIALDPEYARVLQDKALYTAEIDKELRRQDLVKQKASTDRIDQEQQTTVLQAQLDKEKAQTDINVEIASRKGKEIEAANKVYELNDKAFELERLRLLKDVMGKGTIYFIPEGSDLTVFFNPEQGIVPVPQDSGE
jgi:uncharacterized membrane protein YqiK